MFETVHCVHSVYAAKDTLYRRGYYAAQLEGSSLPYSFTACKRGIRYHIHEDYYGDLVEIEAAGRCYEVPTPPNESRGRCYGAVSDRT